MSAVDIDAALDAVRLGEATQAHAAVLADAYLDAPSRSRHDAIRRERDAALEEQRRAVARLAEVSAERDRLDAEERRGWEDLRGVALALGYERAESPDFGEVDLVDVCELARSLRAERDRLLAAVVAQADAWDAAEERARALQKDPFKNATWLEATEFTEALGREMRGAR